MIKGCSKETLKHTALKCERLIVERERKNYRKRLRYVELGMIVDIYEQCVLNGHCKMITNDMLLERYNRIHKIK